MKELKHVAKASLDEGMSDLISAHGPGIYGFYWICLEMIAEELGRNKQHPVTSISLEKLSSRTGIKWETSMHYLKLLTERGFLSFRVDIHGKRITIVCLNLLKYNYKQIVTELYEEKGTADNPNSSVINILQGLLQIFDSRTILESDDRLKHLDALLPTGDIVNISEIFHLRGEKFTELMATMDNKETAMYAYFIYSVRFLLNIYKQVGSHWRFKTIISGETHEAVPTSSISREQLKYANSTTTSDKDFEEFWSLYPRKTSKPRALDAWKIQKKKGVLPPKDKLFQILKLHINSSTWQDKNGQFIPNPANWLIDGRWDDDLAVLNRVGGLVQQIQAVQSPTKLVERTDDGFKAFLEQQAKLKSDEIFD